MEILTVLELQPDVEGVIRFGHYSEIVDNLRSALNHMRLSNPLWSELARICVDMLEPDLNRRLNAVDLLAELNALEKGTPKLTPRYFAISVL
jgi:hypothetical protein